MTGMREPNISRAWNTDPAPVLESKVAWASTWVFLGLNVVLYMLELIRDTPVLVTPLPDWMEPPLLSAIPTLLALVAGYLTKHTPRPDLPATQR